MKTLKIEVGETGAEWCPSEATGNLWYAQVTQADHSGVWEKTGWGNTSGDALRALAAQLDKVG